MKTTREVFVCALALLVASSVFGQAPPDGYVTVEINGLKTTVPTIDTAMAAWVKRVENVPIASLVNEGLVTPASLVREVSVYVKVMCAEAGNTLPGCDVVDAVAQPFANQLSADLASVPKWGLDVSSSISAAVAAAKPAPVTASPGAQPLVGGCYSTQAFGTVCSLGPGLPISTAKDGTVVSQNGADYLLHVSQGLMGTVAYFTRQ